MNTKILGVLAVIALLCVLVACGSQKKSVREREYDPLECASDKLEDRLLLFYVQFVGDEDNVKFALQNNADPNVADRIRQTALMWACHYGNLPVIKVLLDYGASVDRKSLSPFFMYNALFAFVMSQDVDSNDPEAADVMKTMIARKPGILNMKDYFRETVVHKIARMDRPEFLDVVRAG